MKTPTKPSTITPPSHQAHTPGIDIDCGSSPVVADATNSKASWTPGPWIVIRPGEHGHTKHRVGWSYGKTIDGKEIVGAIADICISRPVGFKMEISPEEQANARLIAASPCLLAACQAMLDGCDKGFYSLPAGHYNAIRLAINKALGGAK